MCVRIKIYMEMLIHILLHLCYRLCPLDLHLLFSGRTEEVWREKIASGFSYDILRNIVIYLTNCGCKPDICFYVRNVQKLNILIHFSTVGGGGAHAHHLREHKWLCLITIYSTRSAKCLCYSPNTLDELITTWNWLKNGTETYCK